MEDPVRDYDLGLSIFYFPFLRSLKVFLREDDVERLTGMESELNSRLLDTSPRVMRVGREQDLSKTVPEIFGVERE